MNFSLLQRSHKETHWQCPVLVSVTNGRYAPEKLVGSRGMMYKSLLPKTCQLFRDCVLKGLKHARVVSSRAVTSEILVVVRCRTNSGEGCS